MATPDPGSGFIRIYTKGRPNLGRLTLGQRRMAELGDYATTVWKNRQAAGLNTFDQAAKPLERSYQKRKLRKGLSGIRDHQGFGVNGGHMLDKFGARTVSDTTFRGSFTTLAARQKALRNEQIEPFCAFSPRDQEKILDYARTRLVPDAVKEITGN